MRKPIVLLTAFVWVLAIGLRAQPPLLTAVDSLRESPVDRPQAIAVSADGRHLYALGNDALALFERDPVSGAVLHRETLAEGSDGIRGIGHSSSLTLTRDDRFLYVAVPRHLGDDGVLRRGAAIFERDPVDGSPRFLGIESEGFLRNDRFGGQIVASPDDAHLYLTDDTNKALVIYERDPLRGGLRFVDGVAHATEDPSSTSTRHLSLDPAGRHVYVTHTGLSTVSVFERDPASGRLRFVQEVENGRGRVRDMEVPRFGLVSPDGAHLYVLSTALSSGVIDGTVIVFERDPASGRLTFVETQSQLLPQAAAIRPDGSVFYVAGKSAASGVEEIVIYARDNATGRLRRTGSLPEGDEFVEHPGSTVAMTVSADGRNLYTSLFRARPVAAFEVRAGGDLHPVDHPADPSAGRGALRRARRLTVSPDTRHLYVTSDGSLGIAVFERDTVRGTVELLEVRGHSDDDPVAVSADGRWVYGKEHVWRRDAASGRLSRVDQAANVELRGVDIAPSHDGRHVYVIDGHAFGVPLAGYAQDESGQLTPIDLGIGEVGGLGLPRSAVAGVLSPDGAFLYTMAIFEPRSSPAEGALLVYARDADTGTLRLDTSVGLGLVSLNLESSRLAISGDGRHLYRVRPTSDEISAYRHNRQAGALILVDSHPDYYDEHIAELDGPNDIAVSPSGRLVYVAGHDADALLIFERDPATGELTFIEALTDPTGEAVPGLLRPWALAVSPDDRFVYTVSEWANALSVLALDCLGSARALCGEGGRFRVEVTWRDGLGQAGLGRPVPIRSELGGQDSRLFWFFDPDNWEMLVKVLDGCALNGHFWVFAAATTDVEYLLRVTDTASGAVREYRNPLGVASPAITDTSAFAACR